jgi:ATP-dependent exoDNAse (exonuclease V) alpha subunit
MYSLVQEDEEPVITMLGQFADKMVGFERGELSALHLAYAMTAHSSQGSEFKAVVVPILKQHSFMLTRQLLYTIITRAQEYVLLIGDPAVLAKAVRNTRGSIRSTSLRDRLRASFGLPTLTQVLPIAAEELVRAPVVLSPEEEDAINQLL